MLVLQLVGCGACYSSSANPTNERWNGSNMPIATQKFIRKPLYVDAVQLTLENFDEVVAWCQGEVRDYNDNPLDADRAKNQAIERYIFVRVHNPKTVRQSKAFVGDWLLYTERGYKVYTQKAFRNSFDKVPEQPGEPEPVPAAEEQGEQAA